MIKINKAQNCPPPRQAEQKHERIARDERQLTETLSFRCWRERCCLARGAVIAFTLAEVLITLGIIGVVAALTIAPLVQKYKIKQLEVAFKRSSSLIQQALNNTAIEFGYSNFNDFNQICEGEGQYKKDCSNWRSENTTLITNIQNTFINNFNNPIPITQKQQTQLSKIQIKSFDGSLGLNYTQLYGVTAFNTPSHNMYFLNDNSIISGLTFYYHQRNDGITFTFDTNGPYKGPNRYGYDLFIYTTETRIYCVQIINPTEFIMAAVVINMR